MRECKDEVLLGMMRLWSALSRVGGRSPVRGRRLRDGAMMEDGIDGSVVMPVRKDVDGLAFESREEYQVDYNVRTIGNVREV